MAKMNCLPEVNVHSHAITDRTVGEVLIDTFTTRADDLHEQVLRAEALLSGIVRQQEPACSEGADTCKETYPSYFERLRNKADAIKSLTSQLENILDRVVL